MTENEIFCWLKEILAKTMDHKVDISMESHFAEDLGLKSLDTMALLYCAWESFRVDIDTTPPKTVRDFVLAVVGGCNKKGVA